MMKKQSKALVWLVVISVGTGPLGCARQRHLEVTPPSTKAQALESEFTKATAVAQDEERRQDTVDEWLRAASMALDAGQPEKARDILAQQTNLMASLAGAKDFTRREGMALQTLGGKEQEKYYLGDPHEQLLAYLYLGLLDFQAGDFQNARASFLNASLADRESATEGYNSDCYLAMLLEGVSALRAGDQAGADAAFRFAADAFAFRQAMPLVTEAVLTAIGKMRPEDASNRELEQLDRLVPLVMGSIPVALTVEKEPKRAINAAFDAAAVALKNPAKGSEGHDFLKVCGGTDHLQDATALLEKFRPLVLASLSPDRLEHLSAAQAQFGMLVAQCQAPETNVFILQQLGQGPAKVRSGRYGEVTQFYTYPCASQRMLATVSQVSSPNTPVLAMMAVPGESVDYQARTRGGRAMDSVLHGRATFRDAMNVTSGLATGVTSAALYAGSTAAAATYTATTVTYTTTSTGAVTATTTTTTSTGGMAAATPFLVAAAAALVVYQGAKMIADATHPEADIRGWHEVPSQLLFACGSLPTGGYSMKTDFFDRLGQPLTDAAKTVEFTVAQDRPTLVLCGTPWADTAQP